MNTVILMGIIGILFTAYIVFLIVRAIVRAVKDERHRDKTRPGEPGWVDPGADIA